MSLQTLWSNYLDQPCEVSIETLAQCNARCTFCPYPTLERIGARMPDELIHRLIDEMAAFERPFFCSFFKVNEPLLDKRFIPLCERFNRLVPHARLRVFTNASPLTEAKEDGIAALQNVEHLWVSLNECDPQRYESIMGLQWERTAANLDRLHAREDFPHPVWLSKVGIERAQEFVDYCAKRWPKFKPFVIKQDAWIDYTTADKPEVPDKPCSRWFELNVMATGKVALCCMDGTGEFEIGDVTGSTLLDVYNAPHWRVRRERMMSRQGIYPCNQCAY